MWHCTQRKEVKPEMCIYMEPCLDQEKYNSFVSCCCHWQCASVFRLEYTKVWGRSVMTCFTLCPLLVVILDWPERNWQNYNFGEAYVVEKIQAGSRSLHCRGTVCVNQWWNHRGPSSPNPTWFYFMVSDQIIDQCMYQLLYLYQSYSETYCDAYFHPDYPKVSETPSTCNWYCFSFPTFPVSHPFLLEPFRFRPLVLDFQFCCFPTVSVYSSQGQTKLNKQNMREYTSWLTGNVCGSAVSLCFWHVKSARFPPSFVTASVYPFSDYFSYLLITFSDELLLTVVEYVACVLWFVHESAVILVVF